MKSSGVFSKALSLILAVCMLFSLASCGLFGGSLELKSFVVDRSTVKTSYIIGEEIDFTGISATATYSDESYNKVYTFEELTIKYDADITATVGTKQVTVSFMDPNLNVEQSTTVAITVNEDPNAVKHSHYRADTTALTTAYLLGETVDFSAIKVFEVFSDNSEVELTDLAPLTYSPALNTLTETAGNKIVMIQYNGEDAGTVTVKVSDPEVIKNDVISAVPGGNYKNTYEVGDTLDITGLTVTITYEEGETFVLTHESLTAVTVDMSAAGKKDVVISFTDPINNEIDYVSISITLVHKDIVAQFQSPAGIIAFESDNKSAGTLKYGDKGFSDEYLLGNQTYVVGDDNEWRFNPQFAIEVDGIPTTRVNFYSAVELYVLVDGEFVALEKAPDATNPLIVTYKNADGEIMATVDTYRGAYQFGANAINKRIKLSVFPSTEYYKDVDSFNPVVFEFRVIDAYNVYDAAGLSVVDNSGREGWTSLKTSLGLAGINPAGVVLHNDISITYKDVPADFFHKSNDNVQYYNTITGETKYYANTAGMNYLKDETIVYERIGAAEFTIQGNFFTIDVSEFPLVASPSIFGAESDKDYGTDYSNAALFRMNCTNTPWQRPEEVSDIAYVTIDNIAFIGNAGIDSWTVQKVHGEEINSTTELVTAGGLIMLKSTMYANTTFNNVLNHSFFISYMPDWAGSMTVNSSKCYDSYQNAAFVWADSVFTVNDSYISGTGGPVVISQSAAPWGPTEYHPTTNINNSMVETHVTGEEIWFKAVGATSILGQVKGLAEGLEMLVSGMGAQMGADIHASFVDSSNKMNIIGALMVNSSNAADALGDITVQGCILTDGNGLNRWYSGELADPTWTGIYTAMTTVKPELAKAPILLVHDASGNAQVLIYDGNAISGFCDVTGAAIGTNPAAHAAIIQAFATADEITLFQGGLAILFELYH